MLPGIYAACSGMCARALRHDVVAHNLANVSTPGFKAQGVVFTSVAARPSRWSSGRPAAFLPARLSAATLELPEARGSFTRSGQGGLYETGSPLDLALEGEGYLVVAEPRAALPGGAVGAGVAAPAPRDVLLRGGSFAVRPDGTLTLAQQGTGRVLMGVDGPVMIDPSRPFVVDAGGRVLQGGAEVARLRLVPPAKGGAAPAGQGAEGGPADGAGPEVRQGFLEMSNVNAVSELVDMIAALRAYETCQKVIVSFDETLAKSVNDVGRV